MFVKLTKQLEIRSSACAVSRNKKQPALFDYRLKLKERTLKLIKEMILSDDDIVHVHLAAVRAIDEAVLAEINSDISNQEVAYIDSGF